MYLGEFKYLGEFSFILIFFVPYCVFSCLLSCVCPCQLTLISLTAVLWSSAPSPNPPTSGVVLSYISYVLLLLPFLFFFVVFLHGNDCFTKKKKITIFIFFMTTFLWFVGNFCFFPHLSTALLYWGCARFLYCSGSDELCVPGPPLCRFLVRSARPGQPSTQGHLFCFLQIQGITVCNAFFSPRPSSTWFLPWALLAQCLIQRDNDFFSLGEAYHLQKKCFLLLLISVVTESFCHFFSTSYCATFFRSQLLLVALTCTL